MPTVSDLVTLYQQQRNEIERLLAEEEAAAAVIDAVDMTTSSWSSSSSAPSCDTVLSTSYTTAEAFVDAVLQLPPLHETTFVSPAAEVLSLSDGSPMEDCTRQGIAKLFLRAHKTFASMLLEARMSVLML